MVNNFIEEIWAEYDKDHSGMLEKDEMFSFMKKALSRVTVH